MRLSGVFQFWIRLEVFPPANLLCDLSKQAFNRFDIVYNRSLCVHKATQFFSLFASKLFRNLSVLFQITFAANEHWQTLLLTWLLALGQMMVPLLYLVKRESVIYCVYKEEALGGFHPEGSQIVNIIITSSIPDCKIESGLFAILSVHN